MEERRSLEVEGSPMPASQSKIPELEPLRKIGSMFKVKKILKIPELYCACLLIIGVAYLAISPIKVEKAVFTYKEIQRNVELPFSENLEKGAAFKISFDVVQKEESPFALGIVPDDCANFVSINGHWESLGHIKERCDFKGGFTLSDSIISKYRNGLITHFEFEIQNVGWQAGIRVYPKEKNVVRSLARCFTLVLTVILCVLLARRWPEKKRCENVEIKKTGYITFVIVVSAFAVLTLHTNNCFWRFSPNAGYWFSANIIECVFYFAVPLFFMVSGITLMDFYDRYSLKKFFSKRFMKAMLPFLVWSLIAIGIDLYTGKRLWSSIDFRTVFQDITGNRCVSMFWFFVPLFIVYLCMPLYAAVEKNKRKFVFSYLVGIAFVFNMILPFLKNVFSSDLNTFLRVPVLAEFLIWPLLGWLLHNCEIKKWQKVIIYVLALSGLMMHICGTYVLSMEAGRIVRTFKGYENVPSVLYAMGVFVFLKDVGTLIMKNERVARLVGMLGRYAFEVYLLQFILFAWIDANPAIDRTSMVYRLGAPFVMIPIIIAFTWCLRKIPILRNIVP